MEIIKNLSGKIGNKIINTNVFNLDIFDIFSNGIKESVNGFDLDDMNLIDLLNIRKKTKKVFTNKSFYKTIINNIYSKIKISYPYSSWRFKENNNIYEMIYQFKEILDICYKKGDISKQEYIFVMQDILGWGDFSFDGLFTKILEFDSSFDGNKEISSKYSMRLEKQNKYSKQVTDSISGLTEIPLGTYIVNIHIETHEKDEKFDIKKLSSDIYEYCKIMETEYHIKPEYICNFTHLSILFRRYGFDIYDLSDDISSNTGAYKNKIMEKLYQQKPDDMSESEWLDYQKKLPKLQNIQNKFTYKDIKFGIMEYDKFIAKIEDILQITKDK